MEERQIGNKLVTCLGSFDTVLQVRSWLVHLEFSPMVIMALRSLAITE